MHIPSLQLVPPTQGLLQPPQLLESVAVLTQADPHVVSSAGQLHIPTRQDAPSGQAVPPAPAQPPQFFGSNSVLLQVPSQSFSPSGHTQLPSRQESPAPQA
jgi:hypothetical protein